MHYGTVATFNHATSNKVPGSNVRRIVDAVPIVAEVAVNVRNPSASLVLVGFCLGYRLVDLPFLDQASQLFSPGRFLLCSTDENVRELIGSSSKTPVPKPN